MIPVAQPWLGKKELEYVSDCILGGWVSSRGEFVKSFENQFASFCGTKYGVATTSGTTALHLVLTALGIQRGDEVILPTLTFVATANAIRHTGATPVFIDSESITWNIDPEKISKAITTRTRAIIVVHLFGHPADMDPIIALAEKHNLILIEDAAQAHGAIYKGRRIGSLGDVATFSFFGNKIITTGEGGMIVTNNETLAQRCEFLGNHAREKDDPYWHTEIGFNYRMSNLQAALGLAQLERVEELIDVRTNNALYYKRELSALSGLMLPPCLESTRPVHWMYTVLIEEQFGLSPKSVMERLKHWGIETRPVFYPLHLLPIYKQDISCPVAEEISYKGVSLPSGATLTLDQVSFVCEVLRKLNKDNSI